LALAAVAASGAPAGASPPTALFLGQWEDILPMPKDPHDAPPLTRLTVGRDPEGDRILTQWLLTHARRVLAEVAAGRPVPEPTDAAPVLRAVSPRVEVSLRIGGRIVGLASALGRDVIESTGQAVAAAAGDTRFRGRGLGEADLGPVRIGIALHSRPQQFPFPYGVPARQVAGSQAHFIKFVEIGVYGFGAEYKGRRVQFSAGVPVVTGDPEATETVLELYRQFGISDHPRQEGDKLAAAVPEIKFYRFRCEEFIEHPADRSIVHLYRGVEPFAMTDLMRLGREGVREMCQAGAEHLLARQKPDGSFNYLYHPVTDRWSEADNEVRQAGAAWAMSVLAGKLEDPRYVAAAVAAIRRMQKNVLYLDAGRTLACILDDEGEAKLGTVALALCAILDLPPEEQARFAPFRNALLAAVLERQKADGSFRTYFRPADKGGSEDYAPGEALLALAKAFQSTGDRRCLEALQQALGYYRPYFRRSPNLSFVTWQAQAYALLYETAERLKMEQARTYADFVMEMCDWLLGHQFTPGFDGWPDCLGGFVAMPYQRPGIGTAAYLEGLAAGMKVVNKVDPTDRGPKYAVATLCAMRMVGQLYCRPADTYYMSDPREMKGGFRFSLLVHSVRMDNNQHAVLSLLAAAEAIFKPASRPASSPAD
jgi:hypothetical protein